MNDKPRFETIDLVKLIVLLVLIAIAAFLYFGQGKIDETRAGEIELPPIDQTETAQTITDKGPDLVAEEPGEEIVETIDAGEEIGEQPEETAIVEESTTGDMEQAYPEVPSSIQELVVDDTEGKILTTDGTVVYILSIDRQVWIPAVPQEYSESTGGAAPQQDVDGNWYLVSETTDDYYVWDSQSLVWVPIENLDEVVLLPSLPESGESSQEGGITEGSETTGGEGQTSGEASGGEAASEEEQASTGEQSSEEQDAEQNAEQNASVKSPADTSSTEDQSSTQTGSTTETIATPIVKKPNSYTMRSGEFVYCIARRFDLDPYAILRLNNLRINAVVRAGTSLKLPSEIGAFPGERALRVHPGQYTVKAGDTIHTIACLYGDVTPEAIVAVNQLEPPYLLSVGRILNIP